MKRIWEILIPGLLLLGAIFLRFNDPLPVQYLRNLVFDTYQRLAPRIYDPALPVRVADIDEKSIAKFGQWPWSRAVVARIVDRLHDLGAAVVVLDIIYTEPDRTAPKAIIANLPDDPQFSQTKVEMAKLPDPDEALAAALARAPSVVSFALLTNDPHRSEVLPINKAGFASNGDSPVPFLQQTSHWLAPLPIFQQAAAGIGAVNSEPDFDGVVRRVPLVVRIPEADTTQPFRGSLASESLRVAQGATTYIIRASGANANRLADLSMKFGVERIKIGNAVAPTAFDGALILYDTGRQPARFVSIADIMNPGFDPTPIRGQIVFIGASAEALGDLKTTPLEPLMPGVELHVQVVEQILSNTYLMRPFWAISAEVAYLFAFGLLIIVFARRASALAGLLLVIIAVTAAIGGSWYAFKHYGFLLDPLYPSGVALVLFMGGTLINFLRTEREKRYVRGAFSRYLSPVLVEQLSEHPERLKLGGEIRELTLMFTDIRGFTKMSEGLDPESLTKVINSFLTPMTRVIQDSKGTIDKYIGDCIMAFWNAPIDVESHGRQAIKAALGMRQELVRLNARFKEEAAVKGVTPVEIKAGIGLNSGLCCVGNLGSEQTFNYSALGDTVNIASRLEALSPAYGVDLVIGEETAEAALDYAQLELDLVRVKGKLIPIRIFTALGDEQAAASPEFKTLKERHGALLAAYRRQDWDAALSEIEACRPMAPAFMRGFYEVYAERVAEFRTDPPPADWDGVYVATTKSG